MAKKWRPKTAIPGSLRSFGRVPDFDSWHPGDLILTKSRAPDFISKAIRTVQEPAYGAQRAQWTHAAVYLGDELMLCEAQFDATALIFKVIVAPCWNYFGTNDLLVKRSKWAMDREKGWAIATAAATKIGNAYDWQLVLKLAADRVLFGKDVFIRDQSGNISANSYVCSSLYSMAHAYATDVTIIDKMNNLCVPAFLAGEQSHLQTIEFEWCDINLTD